MFLILRFLTFCIFMSAMVACTDERSAGDLAENEKNREDTITGSGTGMSEETETNTIRQSEQNLPEAEQSKNNEDKKKQESSRNEDTNWTAGITESEGATNALIADLEIGGHQEYTRVVIEFQENIPTYHIEYVDSPVYKCGSGEAYYQEGDGILQIRLRGTKGHTEQGEATVPREKEGMGIINQLVFGCDFEAEVTLWIDVKSPEKYKVLTLKNPARLVVDIKNMPN